MPLPEEGLARAIGNERIIETDSGEIGGSRFIRRSIRARCLALHRADCRSSSRISARQGKGDAPGITATRLGIKALHGVSKRRRAHTWRSPATPTALRNHGKRKGDALSARSRTTSRHTSAAHCSQKARSLPCTAHRICTTAATARDERRTPLEQERRRVSFLFFILFLLLFFFSSVIS